MLRPLAEQRAAVRIAHKLEQGRVAPHLAQGHGGQRLIGLMIELKPRPRAGMHVEIGGRRAVTAVDLRRVSPANSKARLHFRPKLCTFVPSLNQAFEGEPSPSSTRAAGS